MPRPALSLRVEENDIVDVAVEFAALLRIAVSTASLPDNLASMPLGAEYRVHQHLQVVAGRRIAMQIDRPRHLEHAMQFDQARGHHREIGHHVAVAKEGAESAHGFRDTSTALDDFLVGALGVHVPLPRVLEGHDLRTGTRAVFFREEYVVVLTAVERRVEVDEVNRLILDVLAQDFEIVAVIEFVLFHCGTILTRIRRLRNLRVWYAAPIPTSAIPPPIGRMGRIP